MFEYAVTATATTTDDGFQCSRQVPAFTVVERSLTDAERAARDALCDVLGEMSMDVAELRRIPATLDDARAVVVGFLRDVERFQRARRWRVVPRPVVPPLAAFDALGDWSAFVQRIEGDDVSPHVRVLASSDGGRTVYAAHRHASHPFGPLCGAAHATRSAALAEAYAWAIDDDWPRHRGGCRRCWNTARNSFAPVADPRGYCARCAPRVDAVKYHVRPPV